MVVGESISVTTCYHSFIINFFSSYIRASNFDDKSVSEDNDISSLQVTSIVAYSKGFACSSGLGTVHLFEKSDEKDIYKKTRIVTVDKSYNNLITFFIIFYHKDFSRFPQY